MTDASRLTATEAACAVATGKASARRTVKIEVVRRIGLWKRPVVARAIPEGSARRLKLISFDCRRHLITVTNVCRSAPSAIP